MRDTIKLAIRIDEMNDAYYDHPSSDAAVLAPLFVKLQTACSDLIAAVSDELGGTLFITACQDIDDGYYTDSSYDELSNALWDFIIAAVIIDARDAGGQTWAPVDAAAAHELLATLPARKD